MKIVKFQENVINGNDESTLSWVETKKDVQLMVEVFTTEENFQALAPHWKDLARRADSKVYMSYEWAWNWWKRFGRNKKRSLYLVTIWDGTKLVALAPFYKGYSKLGPLVMERRMQIIGSGGSPNEQIGYTDDYGISDFLDILVDQEYHEEVADLLPDILTAEYLNVDVLTFHQADDESFVMKHLYPKFRQLEIDMRVEKTDTCPYIDLRGYDSMKSYIKDQKSNARRRIRQTLRATGPNDEYEIKGADTWAEVEKATDKLIELHQNRWNEIGFPGVFYDERFIQFFKDIIKDAFENDKLWFKQAIDERGVCASRMILFYNGRYYDYISGFDDNRPSSKYRPGIGLLVSLVQEAIENGVEKIELLRGEETYKYDFTSNNFNNWKLTMPLREPNGKTLLSVNRSAAFLYKHINRETELLKVQQSQVGLVRMLPEYLKFRWKSVKMKFDL
ncbi:MAG TPA: GNAT family N-acetyltransferase [Balneolaceae bacterium]